MQWEEKMCRAKSFFEQGTDPDMRTGQPQPEAQTLHLLRKEGRHSLWIQVKGELVGWEGKDDQGDVGFSLFLQEMRSHIAGSKEQ